MQVGDTPLHMSAVADHAEICEVLIDQLNAKVSAENKACLYPIRGGAKRRLRGTACVWCGQPSLLSFRVSQCLRDSGSAEMTT